MYTAQRGLAAPSPCNGGPSPALSKGMYYFKVKSLPVDAYQILKTLKTQYGLSNWQGVILAVHCLVFVATDKPKEFETVLNKVKVDHPDKLPAQNPVAKL